MMPAIRPWRQGVKVSREKPEHNILYSVVDHVVDLFRGARFGFVVALHGGQRADVGLMCFRTVRRPFLLNEFVVLTFRGSDGRGRGRTLTGGGFRGPRRSGCVGSRSLAVGALLRTPALRAVPFLVLLASAVFA